MTVYRNNQKRRKIKHMQSKRLLLGIAGQARSGKDTIATYLKTYFGFYHYAFAGPVKHFVNDMFDWDNRHSSGVLKEEVDPYWGFSPRQAYQLFGTEFGRALNPNIWIMMMQRRLQKKKPRKVVISDVRFPNEALFIRNNGILLHVFRENKEKVIEHSSEIPIKTQPGDLAVSNNGTIEELYENVERVLKPYIMEVGEPWQKNNG